MMSRFIAASEVRIHAHICGDGHLYTEKGDWGTRYIIEYTNTNQSLFEEFINDAKHAYNASPTVIWRQNKRSYIARFKLRYAFRRLTSLGAGSSNNWRIDIKILGENKLLIVNWLRAFFDDEAYVDTSTKRIAVTSVNLTRIKGRFYIAGIYWDKILYLQNNAWQSFQTCNIKETKSFKVC